MKSLGTYVTRGAMRDNNLTTDTSRVLRIPLFDGRYDTAYVIRRFVIASQEPNNSGLDCSAVAMSALHIPVDTAGNLQWYWDDVRQLAWASSFAGGGGTVEQSFDLADNRTFIVEDLYLVGESNAALGAGTFINYYLELEKFEITDWEGALAMASIASGSNE